MDITSLLALGALVLGIVIGFVVGWKVISYKMELGFQKRVEIERGEAVRMSRSSLTGKFSEQLAPFLPNFPYDPTEARFLGSPIDFVIFKGLSQKEVKEIIFLEVKTGESRLTQAEKSIRDTIKSSRIKWEEYHAPVHADRSDNV